MPSLDEMFAEMQRRLSQNPARVAGLNATYQFELSGEGGGTYYARFADGKVETGPGAAPQANCTIQMAAADFQAMVAGQLNPTTAFMTGKLKLKGDMGLALRLQSIL